VDMTLNLLAVTARRKCRFVFASSSHTMGGYKDTPLRSGQKIDSQTPPAVGTRTFVGGEYVTPTAYGSTKLFGERAVEAAACASGGQLTGVNLRIGWIQRGKNLARTIGIHGGGIDVDAEAVGQEEVERSLAWYRGMWLSNNDYLQLLEKALTADPSNWPAHSVTIAGMSNNRESAWDLTEGRAHLGYEPVDDLWQSLTD
jgi:hypothetical protein